MASTSSGEVTRLLRELETGGDAARERLFELAYEELRALAAGLMRSERPEHTLQPTALVHEAAARLLDAQALKSAPNRAYFFGAMARAMRRVLVDHARRRSAARRGGDSLRVPLDDTIEQLEATHAVDLVSLDEALETLGELHSRQAEVVMLRFFAGFTMSEIAQQLEVSVSTVEADWRLARAWLHSRLNPE